jgi:hypothetical protein
MSKVLADIQAKIKAPKDKENTFGKYKYRNAESILAAFKDVQPEGVALTMSDEMVMVGARMFLVSTASLSADGIVIAQASSAAMHATEKKGMDDAQITGACSSYARKYALCGLFAIDDSKDDPDAHDNRDAGRPKVDLSSEALRDAWRDGVEDSLPENATPRQKAEAYAKAVAADFQSVKTVPTLDGRWERHVKIIDSLRERFSDLADMVVDAYENRKMSIEEGKK